MLILNNYFSHSTEAKLSIKIVFSFIDCLKIMIKKVVSVIKTRFFIEENHINKFNAQMAFKKQRDC